jgi:hypothetical protein
MKRFRITILAICLILGWLGFADLSLLLRNQEPQQVSITELESKGAPREWLTVNDGIQDLLQAINMSGSMTIDSFLVPLKLDSEATTMKVWFETRDPQIIEALKNYYFILETEAQKSEFVEANKKLFMGRRPLTGMTADNLVASSNKNKLTELLQEMNIPVSEETIFISEGKEPAVWRGVFFTVIAIIGLVKIFTSFSRQGK